MIPVQLYIDSALLPMCVMCVQYNDISFILRGKTRLKVLNELKNAKTPTQISQSLDTPRSNVSRCILELEKKGFVICLTPNEKMGRLYKLTDFGEKVLDKIKNETI